jgi:hypothetical protein
MERGWREERSTRREWVRAAEGNEWVVQVVERNNFQREPPKRTGSAEN